MTPLYEGHPRFSDGYFHLGRRTAQLEGVERLDRLTRIAAFCPPYAGVLSAFGAFPLPPSPDDFDPLPVGDTGAVAGAVDFPSVPDDEPPESEPVLAPESEPVPSVPADGAVPASAPDGFALPERLSVL